MAITTAELSLMTEEARTEELSITTEEVSLMTEEARTEELSITTGRVGVGLNRNPVKSSSMFNEIKIPSVGTALS